MIRTKDLEALTERLAKPLSKLKLSVPYHSPLWRLKPADYQYDFSDGVAYFNKHIVGNVEILYVS